MTEDEQKAWSAYTSQAREITDNFQREIEGREMPEILYHYTNDVGLRGILESGKLWLTDVFHMNDPSEARYGFQVFMDVLTNAVAARPELKNFSELLRRDNEQREAESLKLSLLYSCSFSMEGDDLGQWRAYADDGRGFALGFHKQSLKDAFTRIVSTTEENWPMEDFLTFPVRYGDKKLKALFAELVDAMLKHNDWLQQNLSQSDFETGREPIMLRLDAIWRAKELSLFFKHTAYENEREYRFLFQHFYNQSGNPSGLKWRSRPYEMVKYLEFDWRSGCPDALRVIRIGPSADQDKAKRFVRECERMFKLASVTIERSEIPYRRVD